MEGGPSGCVGGRGGRARASRDDLETRSAQGVETGRMWAVKTRRHPHRQNLKDLSAAWFYSFSSFLSSRNLVDLGFENVLGVGFGVDLPVKLGTRIEIGGKMKIGHLEEDDKVEVEEWALEDGVRALEKGVRAFCLREQQDDEQDEERAETFSMEG